MTDNQVWHQDSPGVGQGAEKLDLFGSPLATGDFTGDLFSDRAVGVIGEDMVAEGTSFTVVLHVVQGVACCRPPPAHNPCAVIN